MTDENTQKEVTNKDLEQMVKEAKEIDQEESSQQKQSDNKDLQIEELKTALARSMADLQNYKRRTEEDQGRFIKFANITLLKELLPTIDNLNRSTEHLPNDMKDNEWAKGIVQIHDDLLKTLEKIGVKKIETIGVRLDPNFHEGLMIGPGEKDIITEEFEPGYILNGNVIKPAKVKVGDGTE